jgi:pSer/pThr/pTyr-binding forkhead associated (FHA) protein
MVTLTFPALCLTPVQANGVDTPRRIPLVPGGDRVTIGRSIYNVPEKAAKEDNGWFCSYTFSRKHAEVWLTKENEVGCLIPV